MKRLFMITGLLLTVFFTSISTHTVQADAAARRYATCDACGYCVTSQNPAEWQPAPGNWSKCQQCLYPEANPTASAGDTLAVDDQLNIPPTTAPGRHFTVFGCIKTNIGDFTQTGAASSLVQVLLNIIFTTAGGVAILYIIYGSFLIMTSQAEPERLAYGKRVLIGAIVGLVFVFMAVFTVNLLANGILKLPGFGTPTPTP